MTWLRRPIIALILLAGLAFGAAGALAVYFAPAPPSGEAYRLVDGWPQLPSARDLGQVSGVGVDSQGQVFVFHRADRVWQGQDYGLDTIDSPDDPAHFDQPTDVAVAPDGSFFVSDGYGNSRVVRFSPDGQYLGEWGTAGGGPGQFDTPHAIALDAQGMVFVADRGNARLQIFDGEGEFMAEWKGRRLGRPWAVRLDRDGSVYVVDGGDQPEILPDRARILKLDPNGDVLASFGAYGQEPGRFTWPHTIAIGPDGAIYVGEVSTGMRLQKFQ